MPVNSGSSQPAFYNLIYHTANCFFFFKASKLAGIHKRAQFRESFLWNVTTADYLYYI